MPALRMTAGQRRRAILLGAAGAAAVGAAAIGGTLVGPMAAVIAGVAAAVFVVVFAIERAVAGLAARLDDLARDLAQTEPLIALSRWLPTRRPLPPMREFAIAPDFALVLAELVHDEAPAVVVETGSGVSTLVIAYALERLGRGHVWALDHDPRYAARTRAELARHGLTTWATVVDAPLEPLDLDGERHTWHARSALDGIGPIDLVVDDGPPRYLGSMLRYASLPVFAPRLSPRATFVLDVIGDEERAILARWRTRFPELAQELHASRKGHAILRRSSESLGRPKSIV